MAAYTFTAAEVKIVNGSAQQAVAGEAIVAGEFLYLDAADGKQAKRAEADGTVEKAKVVGIALNSAAENQPVLYSMGGEVTVQSGAFAAAGSPLVLSSSPGKAGDVSDMLGGNFLTVVAYTVATNRFRLAINATGVQKA